MYLKRLEIQGFKTFAQRTVLEFPAGVTAVVGPNGSGKSNITDAIRWVLGEQSWSALRCRRTEDLIYSGGGKRAPLGMADVALTIDNTDRTLPLDFNEVTIGRRSYRSGETEYFINKQRVRLRDIQEAIAPLAQSYTLINQGSVDAALTLRPEERRSLFEDAAAISVSASRKADTERRLRQTEANLSRLQDVLAEIEPRLRTLKRQARDAEQVHDIERSLHASLIQQYRQQWHQVQTLLAAAQQRVLTHTTALDQASEQQAQVQAAADDSRRQYDAARAALATHAELVAHSQRDLDALERDAAVLHERQIALERRAAEAEEAQAQLRTEYAATQAHLTASTTRIAELEAQLAAAQAQLHSLETAEHSASQVRRDAEHALQTARQHLFTLQQHRTTQQQHADHLQTQIAELSAQRDQLTHDRATMQAHLTTARAAVQSAQQAVATAEYALQAALAAERSATDQLGTARHTQATAESSVTMEQRNVDTLSSRLDALRRTQASLAGVWSGVRAALQWAQHTDRTDFALVSSILDVPAELETALETALGSRLQHIVVERWDAAEAAIEELKRTAAGRATFLPLDTLRAARPGRVPTGAGIIGAAHTLVHYDGHYTRVVEYLLGRTLVVEDLATARRVLRELEGGWSVVTLGGDQVNASGAMTGGARTRESGTLRRERELRELPDQLQQAQTALQTSETDLARTTAMVRDAEHTLRGAEQHLREVQRQLAQQREVLARTQRDQQQHEHAFERLSQRDAELQRDQHQLETARASVSLTVLDERVIQAERDLAHVLAVVEQAGDAGRAEETRLLTVRSAVATHTAALRAERQTVERLHAALDRSAQQLRAAEERSSSSAAQHEQLRGQQTALATQLAEQRTAHASIVAAHIEAQQQFHALEITVRTLEQQERDQAAWLLTLEAEAGRAHTALAQAQVRRDAVWERCAEENIDIEQIDGAVPTDETLEPQELNDQIQQLRARLKRMGAINPLAPQEYAETQQRYTFLIEQMQDVRQATAALHAIIAELDAAMDARFHTTFAAVAAEFSATFNRLFGGGDAQLVLQTAANGDTPGIEIVAQPPGKRRQPLSLLSGGERSLTAVALLFALLKVNPTPFCVLDEVDAALDEANVVRFRELVAEQTRRTQFIVVTHNRGTVEVADTLYGVSMNADGVSKVLSLRLDALVEAAEAVGDGQ